MTTDFNTIRPQQNRWTEISQNLQTNGSAPSAPPRSTAARSYFRSLHAAEMAAWEATGGDYARAGFVPDSPRARN
jgi:hypothetical protein